jgi:DNA-binding NarL/FixJ family response regulator
MAEAIEILLVDDHAMFRAGIRALIEGEERMKVVGEASTGDEAVDRVRELKPDIVIMDLAMPGSNGLEATRRISALELNTSRRQWLPDQDERGYRPARGHPGGGAGPGVPATEGSDAAPQALQGRRG